MGVTDSLLPLALIGPMGAGKSRIGRKLAARIGHPFIDTDYRIGVRYGPIPEIFEREGEEYFRIVEREVVAEALGESSVVSLGGGAVLHADTQDDLAGCTVVYLTVSSAAVQARLRGSKRPLLQEGFERWQQIFEERRPLYERLASIRIDTSHRSIDSIVDELVTWLKENND